MGLSGFKGESKREQGEQNRTGQVQEYTGSRPKPADWREMMRKYRCAVNGF